MIRELKESDIIGLNSLPPLDWQFKYEDFLEDFLKEDYFYAFVIVEAEKKIGTGNVFFKDKVGWLCNIIIDENYRNKGLGFKMTKYLVDFLYDKGCETQLLIATELGEPIYQKIGFKKITNYNSYETKVDKEFKYSNSIRELKETDLEKLYELDKKANDENRKHLLDKYYRTGLGYFRDGNELLGFYLPNFGRGLVISIKEEVGIELLKIKHSEKGRRTLLPIENENGIAFLEEIGLKEGGKCSRMILGKENNWNPKYIYSYGSGYCG